MNLHNTLVQANRRTRGRLGDTTSCISREKVLGYLYWGWMVMCLGCTLPTFCAIEFVAVWGTHGGALVFPTVHALVVLLVDERG